MLDGAEWRKLVFAAFLMKSQHPAGALRPKIFDLHLQGRGDAREEIGEVATRARSRRSRTVSIGMASISPRTAEAGLIGITWPMISQSNSMRIAASRCFTPGAEWVCA